VRAITWPDALFACGKLDPGIKTWRWAGVCGEKQSSDTDTAEVKSKVIRVMASPKVSSEMEPRWYDDQLWQRNRNKAFHELAGTP
jgi:hypothetical protein